MCRTTIITSFKKGAKYMEKLQANIYQDKHDQIIHDDRQTIYCSLDNNRYSIQSTSGVLSIHCPGCGVKLDTKQ